MCNKTVGPLPIPKEESLASWTIITLIPLTLILVNLVQFMMMIIMMVVIMTMMIIVIMAVIRVGDEQVTWWWPEPNQPQGVKYMEPLAPVVALSRLKSPALSTQVRPTMTL